MGRHRGFVFTMDAAFSLMLIAAMLMAITFFSQQSEKSPYPKLNHVREARDALFVLGKSGVLGSGDSSAIETALNQTLPRNLGARMRIDTYYREEGAFNLIDVKEIGPDAPSNVSVSGVRYDFVSFSEGRISNYSIARLVVWEGE